MVVELAKIERLEKDLEEAWCELLKEDGQRHRILMRDISKGERKRIPGALLTYRGKRSLFGPEALEVVKRGVSLRPGGSGGDLNVFYLRKRQGLQSGNPGCIWRVLHKEKRKNWRCRGYKGG